MDSLVDLLHHFLSQIIAGENGLWDYVIFFPLLHLGNTLLTQRELILFFLGTWMDYRLSANQLEL